MARRMTRQRSTGTLMALALIGGLALLVFSLERGRRHGWSAARRVTREDERGRAPRPAISAEQAVQRAQQHLPDGGQVLSVELQTRTNGMQVYAVTVRTAATTRVIPINAATGAVVP